MCVVEGRGDGYVVVVDVEAKRGGGGCGLHEYLILNVQGFGNCVVFVDT
jgi:hypothetical protein